MTTSGSSWGSAPDPGILGGMAPASEAVHEKTPPAMTSGASAFGAPSAWLFLARLRPRRARLRFTKRLDCTDQMTGLTSGGNKKVNADQHAAASPGCLPGVARQKNQACMTRTK